MSMLLAWVLLACSRNPTLEDVPDAVNDLASAASSAYTHALDADWTGVARDASKAKRAWSTLRQVAEKEGAPKMLLVAVDMAIDALKGDETHEPGPTARIANTISSLANDVYGVFRGALPPALLSLAPAGREVTLDGMDGNPVEAARHLAELDAAWTDIRQDVIDLGGEKEAKDFDKWLDQTAATLETGNLQEIAGNTTGSAVIGKIEDLFGLPWAPDQQSNQPE